MTPDRWQQVQDKLASALELDGEARAEFLRALAIEDAGLCEEVASLLAHADAMPAFLATRASLAVHEEAGRRSMIGRHLGPYELASVLGEGGMGEVYRARRIDAQFRREVAIKVVRAGRDSSQVARRFRTERQILASLQHENIARLIDGGVADDGTPYFVMELIAGEPIDAYCRVQDLGVRERLQIFLQVCAAVQFAHQRLIIHRDLKPGNILVTADGVPKLLDFGIAKLLEPGDVTDTPTAPTMTVHRALTPAYASPEQVRGEPVTTAGDIYSLGVVLYELLTGTLPYPVRGRSLSDIVRVVCEQEPGRPSTVSALPDSADAGGAGASPVHRRARQLKGDLDAIVLKALRKEPALRYASVEQLAQDISRYLTGHPVLAHADRFSYRAGKFVRRYKLEVAAAAVLAGVIVASGLALYRQVGIAREQAVIAGQERAKAEKRLSDVREFSNSLIFDVNDALAGLAGATPARRLLLDRATAYLDRVSADAQGSSPLQRELIAAYGRLARVQGGTTGASMGDTVAAKSSGAKALALAEQVARQNPSSASDQLQLAKVNRAASYMRVKGDGSAELGAALQVTAALLRATPDDPEVLQERSVELVDLALQYCLKGDHRQALEALRVAETYRRRILTDHPDFPQIRRSMGFVKVMLGDELAQSGERAAGEAAIRAGLAFFLSEQRADEVDARVEVAQAWCKLADVQLMNEDVQGAAVSYERARAILQPLAQADPLNASYREDLVVVDYGEARALALQGQPARALPLLRRALAALKTTAAATDSIDGRIDVGAIRLWQGEVLSRAGRPAQALAEYQAASAALTGDPGSGHSDYRQCRLASSLAGEARVALVLGRLAEAVRAAERAVAVIAASLDPALHDVPALYAAATAQASLAAVRQAQAAGANSAAERSVLQAAARQAMALSATLLGQVAQPTRIDAIGSPSRLAATGTRRLHAAAPPP